MISAPAKIGSHVSEVDTPALLIELDALERNIRRMQQRIGATKLRLRPHAKTHKSTAIANMQVAAGAVGVCCQKVSEAEIMVDGGIGDVLVSNEVIGTTKLERLAALARRAKIAVCVDDSENVRQLTAAAEKFGANIDVLVELNVGANRCGIDTATEAVHLATAIARTKSLRFAGLQAYHGSAQHLRAHEERRRAIDGAAAKVSDALGLLRRSGLECGIVSGAGTGSFEFEIESGVYNELQVGSYVFMDADYGRNLDRGGAPVSEFENSLFVLTTVMSAPAADRAVVDAGLKALSVDSGMPLVMGCDGVAYAGAADEHGRLDVGGNHRFKLGEKIRLIPGHCDPTVNLHDWFVGIRNAHVESVWPVSARGAVF
jgi:D-serine deaminase-like pyridoxal phosphate-dependent protein